MARKENPPFGLGETYYNLFASTTQSSSDGIQYEGHEWEFEDMDPINKTLRTPLFKRCRVVRNTSGIPLLPKRLGNLSLTPNVNGFYGSQVDGYATTLAQKCYPIDEFLPAVGVQPNDLFWIVVEGPAVILTDLAALTSTIALGDVMVAQTAATSGATTAGRMLEQDLTGATAPLAAQVQNYIGRAMTAATTNNTNTGVLVYVGRL